MGMEYGVTAVDYLARAREALLGSEPKSLFYAAFELRCCVETRQADYAEALSVYKGTKIKPWNIGQTGRRIRKASTANQISLSRYDFGEAQIDSYHTPVSDDLMKFAELELGNLLHCQQVFRTSSDNWWPAIRDRLVEGYRMAWLSCQGDSLVPPLWNATTKEVHPMVLSSTPENQFLFENLSALPGMKLKMEISYLKSAPPQWRCDL